jgi:mRNA interferase YafQ
MRTIRRTLQFKRDVKQMQGRGKDLGELKEVLESLVKDGKLSQEYRDHVLVGQYKGTRECHIEPDWLLIYELAESEVVFIRTGSHSDLFR